MDPVLRLATDYLRAGLSVIPIRTDGTKAPALPAGHEVLADAKDGSGRKRRRATFPELVRWFEGTGHGIGIYGGAVSGSLETLDFDSEEHWLAWCDLVALECPGLVDRLSWVRTPGHAVAGPGLHGRYRCPGVTIPGNTKLAREVIDGKEVAVIETRGEGGYALAPGSPPACHPRRGVYEHVRGPALTALEDITPEERQALWDCARALNRVAEEAAPDRNERPPTASPGVATASPGVATASPGVATPGRVRNDGPQPGDDFNARTAWPEILAPFGWTVWSCRGGVVYWRRPGKDRPGCSATTGHCRSERSGDLLHVFSTSAHPFADGKSYSKFAAHALLNHGGDFTAAARDLAGKGYGTPRGPGVPPPGASGGAPRVEVSGATATPGPQPAPARKAPPVETFTAAQLCAMELPPPRWAVEGLVPEGLNLLAGKPKLGKAQPLDALVLTPRGYKPMGSLEVGSQVIGADGGPTRVRAVHPQGLQPVFRVRLSDGTAVEATGDHLWMIQTHNDRSQRHAGRPLATSEIARRIAAGKRRDTYLPLCGPVVGLTPGGALALDPYLVGVLLGDGGLTKAVTLAFGDPDILPLIAPLLPEGVRVVVAPDGRSAGLTSRRGSPNPLLEQFRAWGLIGKKAPAKFVPDPYLTASPADRFALLQGLLDTDGGVDNRRVTFASTSQDLVRAVSWLAESLGGTAKVSSRQTHYRHKGERRAGRPSQVVCVRLPADWGCPFRLPRKSQEWAACRPGIRTPPVRRVVAVEPVGEKPCQCITVEAPDGLYLTEHCIVTHNSWLVLGLACAVALGGVALGTTPVEAGDVLYLALEDTKRRLKDRLLKMLSRQGTAPPGRLTLSCLWPRQGDGGLEAVDRWLDKHKDTARLVVIDTWGRFRPPRGHNGDRYAEDYDSGGALKKLADGAHVAMVAVHHCRKLGADDPLEEISGTLGLSGAADGVFVLRRDRGQHDATLFVTGRDLDEAELALSFDPRYCLWSAQGDAEDFRHSRGREEVLDLFRRSGGALRPLEVAELLGKTREAVRQLLPRMARDGLLEVKNGRYTLAVHAARHTVTEGEVPDPEDPFEQ